MTGPLAGRLALVTGASGLIGRRVCRMLTIDGAAVLAQYRTEGEAVEELRALSGVTPVRVDFDGARWRDELTAAGARRADILVNTAHPASGEATVGDLDPAVLRAHLDTAVLHAELCALAVPHMRAQAWGRVVYIAGALMQRPWAGRGPYAAAKSAATTLTQYLAWEEGRAGITANVVAPGRVVDPASEAGLSPDQERLSEALLARTAQGRFPTPEEVAGAVRLLVAPAASGITGQTVWVTGGEALR